MQDAVVDGAKDQLSVLKMQLELEKLKSENVRVEQERRERQEAQERLDRLERQERDAAHQRNLQMMYAAQQAQAQTNVTTTAITANTAMSTAAQGGGYGAYGTERYCGPLSWIIGLLLFPCICFCPVDERTVRAVPVQTLPAVSHATLPTLAPAPVSTMGVASPPAGPTVYSAVPTTQYYAQAGPMKY